MNIEEVLYFGKTGPAKAFCVDLGGMGIGRNEVIKRQVRLDKKMGVHLEKHDILSHYDSFASLEDNDDKKYVPLGTPVCPKRVAH